MELLQEQIREPGNHPPQQNGHGDAPHTGGGNRSRGSSASGGSRRGPGMPYDPQFAQYDTVAGIGTDFETVPRSQYQEQYRNPTPDVNGQMGKIEVDNGCINLHIPMAYQYAYNPPQQDGFSDKQQKSKSKAPNKKSSSVSVLKSSKSQSSTTAQCDSVPAFCATVRTTRGPPHKGYCDPPPSSSASQMRCGESEDQVSQGKVKTSMAWDFSCGTKIPWQKMDYGEELYEKAVTKLIKQLHIEKCDDDEDEGKGDKEKSEYVFDKDKCRDLSKPGFHSSNKVTRELAKVLKQLETLPSDVERLITQDPRFEPLINEKAKNTLNAPTNGKVFKDLIPLDSNSAIKERAKKSMSEQIKSVRPTTRVKDPEPNLLDYQELLFSRIRPDPDLSNANTQELVRNIVTVDIQNQTRYQMAESQNRFAKEAERI